jgi:uncharacterized protein (TIGR03067 family)
MLLVLMLLLSIGLGWWLRRATSKIEGEWQAVQWSFAEPAFTLTLKDGKYIWCVPGRAAPTVGRIHVNPLVDPPTIDLFTPVGVRLPGIYRLGTNTLTIAHGQAKRPADFSVDYKHGEAPIVMTFHRIQRE